MVRSVSGLDEARPAPPQPFHPGMVSTADPLLGTTVGSFRIVRKLGEGGMGAVYLGEQTFIGSKVAVKFLHEHLASNASLVARFYAEARAVNLIGHENIVNIFDMNVVPPRRYYLIMEYLEGDALSAYAGAPLAAELLVPILTQVCDALQAAHARGVVHRDLKPENLFLVKRSSALPFVKVLDFGIAKLFSGGIGTGETSLGAIIGTPEYMAPEQSNGELIDGRADIYALGVIAYRMVTGRLPFFSTGIAGMLMAHRDQKALPPEQLNPQVSPALSAAILRALAKRREDRYSTAAEFKEALEGSLFAGARAMQDLKSSKTLAEQMGSIQSPPPPPIPFNSIRANWGGSAQPLTPAVAKPRTPLPDVIKPPPPVAELPEGYGEEPLVFFEDESPPPPVQGLPTAPTPAVPPVAAAQPARAATGKTPAGTFGASLLVAGQAPLEVACLDLSKAGMFVCVEGVLPKAFTQVKVSLEVPPGVLCDADVVRLVDAAQARAWGMVPGMGIQFLSPSPAFREHVVRRMQGLPISAPSAPKGGAPQDDLVAEKILKRLAPRKAVEPYTLLALATDAEFADILQRGREVKRELDGLKTRALSTGQRDRLEKTSEFITGVLESISTPPRRAAYDCEQGNFRGVARCMSAGLTVTEMEKQRKDHLARHPGAEAKAHIGFISGRAWENKGSAAEAIEEYERALVIDPLNLQLQQRYWSLKRKP